MMLELALLASLAWGAGRSGHDAFVAPRQARHAALTTELADLRSHRMWVSRLRKSIAEAEPRAPRKLALLKEIEGSFLREENDRLRVLETWDRLVKAAGTLRVEPDPAGSRTEQVTYRTTSDLPGECSELRQRFSRSYPREGLGSWRTPPDSITFAKVEERLRVTGPYRDVFALLERLQSEPVFLEVTSLSLRTDPSELREEDSVTATFTLSTLMLRR